MAVCESCGRDEQSVTKVQRMYLADRSTGDGPAMAVPRVLNSDERPGAGDIEMWCASCCATFPHVAVDTD
ncbi:MAG: hypothetical protein M5U19_01090 [Microthrixaceae bacterium]|nr:hypothetical protein [Microthrixaceae bacterium]